MTKLLIWLASMTSLNRNEQISSYNSVSYRMQIKELKKLRQLNRSLSHLARQMWVSLNLKAPKKTGLSKFRLKNRLQKQKRCKNLAKSRRWWKLEPKLIGKKHLHQ